MSSPSSPPSPASALPETAREVLLFWFGPAGGPEWNVYRRDWFRKSAAFDATVRNGFLPVWERALATGMDDWCRTPEGACAAIVVTDQFPRNMFRKDPRAFATDAMALAVAKTVIARGWDRQQPTPYHRLFCYMPFEHSESLADQEASVRLTVALRDETQGVVDVVDYAIRHRDVIARFGRFPHRNATLGRESTPEETAFLSVPGSSF